MVEAQVNGKLKLNLKLFLQKNEEKDLQKFFQTSFKLEISEAEKKLKEKVELPHMKAQGFYCEIDKCLNCK